MSGNKNSQSRFTDLLNLDNTLFDLVDLDKIVKNKNEKLTANQTGSSKENNQTKTMPVKRPNEENEKSIYKKPKRPLVVDKKEFDAFSCFLESPISNDSLKIPDSSLEDVLNSSIFMDNKKNFESLFNEMERSIVIMGDTENKSHIEQIPQDVMNALLAFDTPTKSQIESSFPNSLKTQNTSLSNTFNNISFNSAMKLALLANATKNSPPTQNLNTSIKKHQLPVENLGPFFGMPLKVKELIQKFKGIKDLYEWQKECLNLPAINDKKNFIYALPTSGGKTLVAEILMFKEILCYKKNVLFVLPYVAIVQEKVWALSSFAVALDFLVEEYAASKGIFPPRKRRKKRSIFVATIEKALGLTNSLIETGRLEELGLIVVDELHLIGEEGRGSTLEALLTKLMFLNANIQIIGMSATIGNIQDLGRFLNAQIYTRDFRPVELIEYIKCGSEIAKINVTNKPDDLFTVVRKTNFQYSEALKTLDPDQIGGLVMEVIPEGSCLIFCPTKKNCENVASLLCKVLDKKFLKYKSAEKEQLKHELLDEEGSLCRILKMCIPYGVAYHHSGLTSEERRTIEDGFRAGIISVICCTSTLAAGVNLPAKRVILRQPYVGREFITLSKYKQMIGRAGRAGLGEIGESILMCPPQDLSKAKDLLLSPMDQAYSSLHKDDGKELRHLLLSCVGLGIGNTRIELQMITKKTLLAVQNDFLEIDLKKLTDKVIRDLFGLGALQEADLSKPESTLSSTNISLRMETSTCNLSVEHENEQSEAASNNGKQKRKLVIKSDTKLTVSKLGSAAIRGNFELNRAHMLYDDLHEAQKSLVLLDALHLLYLITPYDAAEHTHPNKTDYYNIFNRLGPNELQTAYVLGINDAVARKLALNQKIKTVSERVLNRFYLALMLYDLWNEKPVFEVSEKFKIDRGIVQNFMTNSATFASNVAAFCECLDEFWSFSHLLKGISVKLGHCCVKELLPLMELPAVKQNRARQLYNAGFKTLQAIAKASPDKLVESIEFLPRRVAYQLIAASKMLLLEKVENLREEAEDVLEGKL